MDKDQMKKRCPRAESMIIHQLEGYQFIINTRGVATIIPNKNSFVQGVLWSLSNECENSLDRYEGVSSGLYRKEYIPLSNGLFALVYIASDDLSGRPRDKYLEKIIKTSNSYTFSCSYITYLKSLL